MANFDMADLLCVDKGLDDFGRRLFSELAKTNPDKNVIFSPLTIQACIAMAHMGAEGQTALEMEQVSAVSAQDLEVLARIYRTTLAQYGNYSIIKIATKIYIMQGCEVEENFKDLLMKHFLSLADTINFANNTEATETINTWVANKTHYFINGLIAPQILKADARLVLVNAIHFKGEWVQKFPEIYTQEMDFYLDETNTVKVQMMRTEHNFSYGEFPELDATAMEMPYRDTDLSMLIILPNSRTGLVTLEEKLKNIPLSDLMRRMYCDKRIVVEMPKFKAEFVTELSDPLKNLGMRRMFSSDAEFGNMIKSKEPLEVSAFVHKAIIVVNEIGSRAVSFFTVCKAIRLRGQMRMVPVYTTFIVNKPFYYLIKTERNVVLFGGHIKTNFTT